MQGGLHARSRRTLQMQWEERGLQFILFGPSSNRSAYSRSLPCPTIDMERPQMLGRHNCGPMAHACWSAAEAKNLAEGLLQGLACVPDRRP